MAPFNTQQLDDIRSTIMRMTKPEINDFVTFSKQAINARHNHLNRLRAIRVRGFKVEVERNLHWQVRPTKEIDKIS